MIANFSKLVALYVAPILGLTSFILSLLAYLAPSLILAGGVSLASIVPANTASSSTPNGPSVFVGLLGSCARSSNEASLVCTTPSFNQDYDLSVLPKEAPAFLASPITATPVFELLALIFSSTFLIVFTLMCFREKLGGRISDYLGRPAVSRFAAWTGVLGFMIGITSYFVIRMWFGRAIDDFNQDLSLLGKAAPELQASVGNGFTMIWVAYAFGAVPLICALMKLHGASAPPSKV